VTIKEEKNQKLMAGLGPETGQKERGKQVFLYRRREDLLLFISGNL